MLPPIGVPNDVRPVLLGPLDAGPLIFSSVCISKIPASSDKGRDWNEGFHGMTYQPRIEYSDQCE